MKSGGGVSILDAPLLAERTSIRLGGPAIAELRVSGLAGLEALPQLLAGLGGRPAVLGKGTNILADDAPLPLVLISLQDRQGLRVLAEEGGKLLVWADAGLKLSTLLAEAASLSLAGLEGLAGIPGRVGGAVAMNAGSFGVEIGSLVRRLEVFSPRQGLVELAADEVEFRYRGCRFPGPLAGHDDWLLVTGAVLALEKGDKSAIRAKMTAVHRAKRASQPVDAWSAGSAFKNPAPDAPAGRLLEEAGFKGKRLGGMGFSDKHANFLVNLGGGTFAQAKELMDQAARAVHGLFGHTLEAEVKLWP